MPTSPLIARVALVLAVAVPASAPVVPTAPAHAAVDVARASPVPGPSRVPAPQAGPPVVVWTTASGIILSGEAGQDRRLRELIPVTARVVVALDRIAPFAWRDHVVTIAIGCRPVGRYACPGGVVEGGDHLVVSHRAARWSERTLEYVLRHELAHVWQAATADPEARAADLDGIDLGVVGLDPIEAAADCLAAHWGSPANGNGYLDCPADGIARMAEVVARTPLREPLRPPAG